MMKVSTIRPFLAGPVALAVLAVLLSPAQAATYSLASDFSYTENRTDSTWSYRLDDRANDPPAFPLLTLDQPRRKRNLGFGFSDTAHDVE